MDERVQSHGERLATVESSVASIAAALERLTQMSEDIHAIKAAMEQMGRRLDEGSRNFERHDENSRELERRVLTLELSVGGLRQEIYGDGPNKLGLRHEVSSIASGRVSEAGFLKGGSLVAQYGVQGIWAIAVAASAFFASHLMWK
jgi:hypothetical protein